MVRLQSLSDLFAHQLYDLHSAAMQIAAALPQLVDAVAGEEAKRLLGDYRQQTEGQTQHLEEIFAHLSLAPSGETSLAAQGLLRESGNLLDAAGNAPIKDAALLTIAHLIASYASAAYTVASRLAHELGYREVARLLETAQQEEDESANQLSALLYSFS